MQKLNNKKREIRVKQILIQKEVLFCQKKLKY